MRYVLMKNVLFIQGGGEGAYEEDRRLAASLQDLLGAGYLVHYPQMPNEADPEYEPYKAQISMELAALAGELILVGHSLGATVLLRYLTEEKVDSPIAGIFLIAAPFWGAEEWLDEQELYKNLASKFKRSPPIFFYHSRDDEIVPFAHLGMYAKKLPQAHVREYDRRGHQFKDDLSDVAADILSL